MMIIGLYTLVIIFLLIYLFVRNYKKTQFYRQENMPLELEQATLLASEKNMATLFPIPIHGTPDQLYLTADNRVIPVDTKRRNNQRVYPKDVTQLTLYNLIARDHYRRHRPSTYGYIRLVNSQKQVTYKQVLLYNDKAMLDLYQRYQAVKKGRVRPEKTSYVPCAMCQFNNPCRIKESLEKA